MQKEPSRALAWKEDFHRGVVILLSAAAQAAEGAPPPHKDAALARQHYRVGAPAGRLQCLSAWGPLLKPSHNMSSYTVTPVTFASLHRRRMLKQAERNRLNFVESTGQALAISGCITLRQPAYLHDPDVWLPELDERSSQLA